MGAESEIMAVTLEQADQMQVVDSQVSPANIAVDLDAAVQAIPDWGPQMLGWRNADRTRLTGARRRGGDGHLALISRSSLTCR